MTTRKEQTAIRKAELASKLRIGAFVKNVWGATMCRVSYLEIVDIKGTRVIMKAAKITGNPSPNCASDTVTLIGSNPEASELVYGTVRMGYLLKEGESLRDHWSKYEFVEIGDTTHTYSD